MSAIRNARRACICRRVSPDWLVALPPVHVSFLLSFVVMRLAIIRQRYAPAAGAERFFEGALEALLERNVAISLYTRSWPQTKLQLIEPVICDPWYAGAFLREWGFARSACRAISRSKANLVESHERLRCCDIYRARDGVHAVWLEERLKGASAYGRLRLKVSPYNRYMLRVEKRLFASPWLQAVICNSKMVRDEIIDRFRLPESKLHVVYNAVDSDVFHPNVRTLRAAVLKRHGIDEAATVFLLAGSGYEHSGAGAAIEALAELPAPAHLMITGREIHAQRYRDLADSLGVASRVTVADADMDPRSWYGAADAFVLPTLYDPAPESTLEAMACELPVVTSTKSGAAELVLANDAGLVCPAGDIAGLAAQMRTLQDATTRRRLGANARRAVLPLSPAAITLQLVLLYRDLLAATVQSKTGTRGNRRAHATTESPSTTRSAETKKPATAPPAGGAASVPDAPVGSAPAIPSSAPSTPPPAAAASDEVPPG
jgi:UDP-glucose:(heptosyl)LPS alpha-1,3-glucosyltransferase